MSLGFTFVGAHKGKNASAYKGESQAHPIRACAVRIHANQNGCGGAQRSNLRQGEIDKDHAPLHNVDAQVSMYAGQYQTGEERKDQELKDFHVAYLVSSKAFVSCAIS